MLDRMNLVAAFHEERYEGGSATGNSWVPCIAGRLSLAPELIFFADLARLDGKASSNIAEIHSPCRVSKGLTSSG